MTVQVASASSATSPVNFVPALTVWRGSAGYSALAEMPDGRVVLVYEKSRDVPLDFESVSVLVFAVERRGTR